MPLVTDYNTVCDVYQEAREKGIALPSFCAEDRETLEAILASTLEMGKQIGVPDVPIVPAWTCRYPARGQMTLLPACGDPLLGTRLMFSDLEEFMSEDSPYKALRVLPHLDHAFPWLDGDVLNMYVDKFASVMCDASEKPFEENIRITAEYVEKYKGRVVIEGAVDEIFDADGIAEKNEATTVQQAEEYLRRTGVDMIVPNVGTEHRATEKQVRYLSANAKDISSAVGKILCLHGTSSVKEEDLGKLPDDGFVKINVYTTLAVHGGQALAEHVLNNLTKIFSEPQIKSLIEKGIVSEHVLTAAGANPEQKITPQLKFVANPLRRDAWFTAVRERCLDFLKIFHYERFGS